MKRHFSILITADPAVAESLHVLDKWTAAGLIDPFIRFDSSALEEFQGRLVGLLSAQSGCREVDLFETLGKQPYEMVRVVALAGPDLESAQQLGEVATNLHTELERLAPPGMRTTEIRIWYPLLRHVVNGETIAPLELFSTRVHVNLVVMPEDRYAGDTLAAPVVEPLSEAYREHVSVETATVLGLWPGMEDAPVDHLERGVLGYGEAKIHMGRSFVRLAHIDSPRFPTSFAKGRRLPVPLDTVESPYPDAAVNELADRMTRTLLDPLRFLPSPTAQKEGWRAAVVRLARGIAMFFRRLPEWLLDLSRDRVVARVTRAMPQSPLQPFVIQVLRDGADAADAVPKAQEVEDAAARYFHVSGGAKVDQQIWRDMGQALMAAADAGDEPESMGGSPPRARPSVIADLTALAPSVERSPPEQPEGLKSAVQALTEDSRTLLGRIEKSLERIVGKNRGGKRDAASRFDQVVASLGDRPPSDLGWVSMLFAALALLFAVGLSLATGLVETLGITAMTAAERTLAWIVISSVFLVALVITSAFGYHELRIETDDAEAESGGLKRALMKVALVTVGVLFATAVGYGLGMLLFSEDAPGVAAAFGLLALAVGLLWAVRRTFVFRKVLRRFAVLAMVYVAVGIVGNLAREYGWYGQVASADVAWMQVPTAALGIMLLGLSIVAGWWVGWEEHRMRSRLALLHSLEGDIRRAVHREKEAEEAKEQFVGSAITWSEIFWRPFGMPEEEDSPGSHALPSDLQKIAVNSYGLSSVWHESFRKTWVKRIASAGWLSRQYEVAVRDFQRRFAGVAGARHTETMRPDQDPRVVSNLDEAERSEVSLRWSFASGIRSGVHDGVLRERLLEHDDWENAERILNSNDKLIPAGAHQDTMEEMLTSILPDMESEVHHSYFLQKALTEDLDRKWRPKAWLPVMDHSDYREESNIEPIGIKRLPSGSHLASAVRHDLAGPYPATALFVNTGIPSDQPPLDSDLEPIL